MFLVTPFSAHMAGYKINEGLPGKKPLVTSDKLLDSLSKLPCIRFVKQKENLTLHQFTKGLIPRTPSNVLFASQTITELNLKEFFFKIKI